MSVPAAVADCLLLPALESREIVVPPLSTEVTVAALGECRSKEVHGGAEVQRYKGTHVYRGTGV